MTEPAKVALNHADHQALAVLRKTMRDPAKAEVIIEALLKDQSKTLAYTVLKQVGKEINDLLAVARAFTDTTKRLMEELHDDNPENPPR